MSREILFRGKRIDNDKGMLVNNGDWVKGFYFHRSSQHYIKMPHIRNGVDVLTDYEVDPATVGQYTGLKDKNGVKIFEGDVVHCISRTDSANMIVIFEDGEFRMVLEENYASYTTGMGFYAIRCFKKKVISNIHDATPQGEE